MTLYEKAQLRILSRRARSLNIYSESDLELIGSWAKTDGGLADIEATINNAEHLRYLGMI